MLSKEGQKKSLLSGGDGKAIQTIEVGQDGPFFKEYLTYATVDSDGETHLGVGADRIFLWNPVHTHYGVEEVSVNYGTTSTPVYVKTPQVVERTETVEFDSLQDLSDILDWLNSTRYRLIDTKAQAESLREALMLGVDEKVGQAIEKMAKDEMERAAAVERQYLEEEARKKARKMEDDARREWVMEFGSDHLQRGVKAGHSCQRQYVRERLTIELPEYKLDFGDDVYTRERVCPSVAALDELDRVKGLGFEARIVWIEDEQETSDYFFRDGESVMIEKYLGKYYAFKWIKTDRQTFIGKD
jgi:predicted transcriptional regulator